MKKDDSPIFILIILFVIAGFAYGPVNKNLTSSSSSNTNALWPSTSSYTSNKDVSASIKEAEDKIERLEKDLSKQSEERKRSPYYGKVSMSGISGLYSNEPDQEYISLYTSLDKGETINITGWYFKSETTGYFAVIGKAALLPFPHTHTESDIVITDGDRVIITKGFSPIGISFRTNSCTGYFEENMTFYPSLPINCPKINEDDMPKFSSIYDRNDECLDLLDRIPRCSTVNSEYIRDLPDTVTQSCKNYMRTQFNYNACVARNFGDTEFPGNEYRVYLNKFGPLWREKREKINLLDRNGLIVDTIQY